MRAPTRERIMTERMISIMARGSTIMVLAISICFLVPEAAAQSDKYPKMAPVDQHLMERNAEICWRGAPLPIPYPATRRSWYWAVTTTQSRHPTELRHGNPSGLPSELFE
jgi:hypothetical protein